MTFPGGTHQRRSDCHIGMTVRSGRLRAAVVRSIMAWTMSVGLLAGSVGLGGAQTMKLLDYDSLVKYNDSDTDFYATYPSWKDRTFEDTSWQQGQQLLAYEDGSWSLPLTRTILRPSNAFQPPGHATYFRLHFNSASTNWAFLTFSNRLDDGAVFYLNGFEIQRIRVGLGEVQHVGLASASSVENTFDTFTCIATNLVVGDNVIAASVHQSSYSSSDTVFGTEVWAETIEPIVINTQPADQRVEAGATVNFTVIASGTRLQYQWQFNGGAGFMNLLNQTNATLTLTGVQSTRAGLYRMIVSNAVQSVTSAVATLTVLADATPPRVITATMSEASGPRYYVLVQFNERVLSGAGPNGGGNANNYRIESLDNPKETLTISDAIVSADLVRLTVSPWTAGRKYALHVSNVADLLTNVIAPGAIVGIITSMREVLPLDHAWNWSDAGADLGAVWTSLYYDEATNALWAVATPAYFPVTKALFYSTHAPLPGPKNTSLALGTLTFYFRTRFTLPSDTAPNGFIRFNHVIDGGAVFHLNGQEVYRWNMGAGPVSFTNRSASQIAVATLVNSPSIAVTNLISGTNVLAVETHVWTVGSQTLTFGSAVQVATGSEMGTNAPPRIAVRSGLPGQVILEWNSDGAVLQIAPTPLGTWSSLVDAASPLTNAATEPQRFYRLVR